MTAMSEVATMTLSEFLLARIAEDEEAAHRATDDGVAPNPTNATWSALERGACSCCVEVKMGHSELSVVDDRYAPHIARHDPARVLAECEAKRRIVERCQAMPEPLPLGENDSDMIQMALALPYVDHPDFRAEWKP